MGWCEAEPPSVIVTTTPAATSAVGSTSTGADAKLMSPVTTMYCAEEPAGMSNAAAMAWNSSSAVETYELQLQLVILKRKRKTTEATLRACPPAALWAEVSISFFVKRPTGGESAFAVMEGRYKQY